ncbi:MAG: ABC transporter ATP-binding protein [Phycisphaerales bacterium]|nr:ABC transporter ATP-binding protein [Phycisphaerales bacterium]
MLAIATDMLTHEYAVRGKSAIVGASAGGAGGRRRAIENVSLTVPAGSIYGFLGPNGAGKTTTIRALMGFIRPSGGRATVLGLDAWRQTQAIKAQVGYVPGDVRLWPWLTARKTITLFERVRGVAMQARAETLAQRLGLDLRLRVRSMSKGTRQKLGLILAMAHEPKLMILDEPSSGLDPLVQDELRAILREAAAGGATVFLSSHTLAEVEDLCQRVAIVRQGRIVADDDLRTLRARAGHSVTIELAPGMTLDESRLPARLRLDPVGPKATVRTGLHTSAGGAAQDAADVRELLAWLSTLPGVVDVSITRPDLETLFRTYYQEAGR